MFAALAASWFPLTLDAQNGDRPGEPQPEVWRDFEVPPAPVVSPEDALAMLRVAPGFRVELVASEPLVEDPVTIAFDPRGRLWAVEMRAFMPDVDGHGETDPIGRVVVLEDDDGDGTMDRSTAFLTGLVNPRALAIVEGGILLGEPPHLWWARDADGDGTCDAKSEVGSYGNADPDQLEHTENGLLWTLDNWIVNAKSDRRFRWRDGTVEVERTAHRGQWGIARDDWGRLYYNGNSSWLLGDAVPARYLLRQPHAGRAVGQPHPVGLSLVTDQSVFTIRVNPGINRGYEKGMLRADGRLARTTSVSGLTIYRGHQFPAEYRGDAFVPEPAGNVVAHFRLDHDGFRTRAEHDLIDDAEWGVREFLASPDERFRPVDCTVGPDGALYVVDMYRGILQHRQFVTTFLRRQIVERGLDRPIGLGRIYRVVWEGSPVERAPVLLADVDARVRALAHPNGWVRDTAQRLLVESRDAKAIGPLTRLVASSPSELARVHALWTLDGMDALEFELTKKALRDQSPRVRIQALRSGERWIGHRFHESDFVLALMERANDTDPEVRVQLLFTLGGFPVGSASANELRLAVLARNTDDPMVRCAALSGWRGGTLGALRQLCERADTVERSDGRVALFREFAHAALRGRSADLPSLLMLVETECREGQLWRAEAILDGALAFARVGSDTPRSIALARRPATLERTDLPETIHERLSALSKTITTAMVDPLTLDEQARYSRGEQLYATCALCHGGFGEGIPGLGPPLADSSWVIGPPERLVRILLHGVAGPIEVNGQWWNETMVPVTSLGVFEDDGSLADVTTFVRRAWGHTSSTLTAEEIARIRSATIERVEPWSAAELQAVP
ncbi:MAG: hypothetical protein KDC38_09440 [Planctomycetes bacterium]|nr:hypothetical protein [Planctomycetota bacterium]